MKQITLKLKYWHIFDLSVSFIYSMFAKLSIPKKLPLYRRDIIFCIYLNLKLIDGNYNIIKPAFIVIFSYEL